MRTAWVRSPAAVADLTARWAEPAFLDSRVLAVMFETDPELIAAVLPPPLAHDGSGIATAFIGEWRASNCVGPFAGGALNLRARYGDLAGNYCLTMPMSNDTAISFGRELYGEPKRLARVSLSRDDGRATGAIERHGVTYMTLTADLDRTDAPGESSGVTFHVKATPRADGTGFDDDPLLIAVMSRTVQTRSEHGAGSILFQLSPYDPVAEFPVRRVIGAIWTEGDTHTRGRTLAALDPAVYLPYALGKMDPMDAWDAAHAKR